MPIPVYNFGMVAIGTKIYVLGGHITSQLEGSNKTQIYDTLTDTWSYGTPMPITTVGGVSTAININSLSTRIYYIGNELVMEYHQYLNKSDWTYTTNSPTQIYDVQTRNWTVGASSPTTRISGASLAVVNNTMYAIGGYGGIGIGQTSANEQYFPLPNDYQTNTTPTSTPSPTVPEFPFLVILPLLFSILFVAIIVRYRKISNLSK
jgi:N-acetylneuraminic acid mutarotase